MSSDTEVEDAALLMDPQHANLERPRQKLDALRTVWTQSDGREYLISCRLCMHYEPMQIRPVISCES